VFSWVRQANIGEDLRRQSVFSWAVAGLLMEKTVALPLMATVISGPAKAASSVRRLRRWLGNERVEVRAYYDGLIRQAIADWKGQQLVLALDTSSLAGRITVCRLAVVYRGRAIPLVWLSIDSQSSSVAFDRYVAILEHALGLLPTGSRVVLLADRGLCCAKLRRWCHQKGWHYRLRLKGDQLISIPGQISRELRQLRLAPGELRCLGGVFLSPDLDLPVNVAIARPKSRKGESWFVATDEAPSVQTFREYGLRFDIEEAFRDDKSAGFLLEDTKLLAAATVDRLLLVMATAYLFTVATGAAVVRTGKRHWVDTHWQRGLSYFQLGWRAFRRALHLGAVFLCQPLLDPSPDPAPPQRRYLERLLAGLVLQPTKC